MLFRCTGCLTAYCEDCLPQDDVDGEGEHEILDKLGYKSKQAYFIRCLSCKSALLPEGEEVPVVTETEVEAEVVAAKPPSAIQQSEFSEVAMSYRDITEAPVEEDSPPDYIKSSIAESTSTVETVDTDADAKVAGPVTELPGEEEVIDAIKDVDEQMEEEEVVEEEEGEEEEELAILPSQTWIIHNFIPDEPSPPKVKKSQTSKAAEGAAESKKKRQSAVSEDMVEEGLEGAGGRRRSGRLASKYLEVKKELASSKKGGNASLEDNSSSSSSSEDDDEEEEEVPEVLVSTKRIRR